MMSKKNPLNLLLITLLITFSCSKSDDNITDNGNTGSPSGVTCTDPSKFIFNEKDGFIKSEFEKTTFPNDWKLKTNNNASGKGYGVWEGQQSLGKPGNGLIEFKINVKTTGVYRFLWSSAVTKGTNGSDHNDSWLKFPDATDFYGEKNGAKIYPKGSGKTPNPKGSSADGWFKIYRSGNNLDFKWQASTSDNDAHNVYVAFNKAGVYTMQVSARSSGHAIDQFILYKEDKYKEKEATEKTTFSEVSCN